MLHSAVVALQTFFLQSSGLGGQVGQMGSGMQLPSWQVPLGPAAAAAAAKAQFQMLHWPRLQMMF
jgi:hypothetical protein